MGADRRRDPGPRPVRLSMADAGASSCATARARAPSIPLGPARRSSWASINVTPDSFSDGGRNVAAADAVAGAPPHGGGGRRDPRHRRRIDPARPRRRRGRRRNGRGSAPVLEGLAGRPRLPPVSIDTSKADGRAPGARGRAPRSSTTSGASQRDPDLADGRRRERRRAASLMHNRDGDRPRDRHRRRHAAVRSRPALEHRPARRHPGRRHRARSRHRLRPAPTRRACAARGARPAEGVRPADPARRCRGRASSARCPTRAAGHPSGSAARSPATSSARWRAPTSCGSTTCARTCRRCASGGAVARGRRMSDRIIVKGPAGRRPPRRPGRGGRARPALRDRRRGRPRPRRRRAGRTTCALSRLLRRHGRRSRRRR